MRRRAPYSPFIGIVVAVLFIGMAASARAQSMAALVTDSKGKVEIQRPGQPWTPASVMAQVPAGSHVRLARGGEARLSYVDWGLKMRLVGPISVRIERRGATLEKGLASNMQLVRPGARRALAVPANVNVNRMGGMLQRAVGVVLLSRDSMLVTQPLRWRNVDDKAARQDDVFDRYEVRVQDPQKVDQLGKGGVVLASVVPGKARSLSLPPGKLEAGKTYNVTVRGVSPRPAAESTSAHIVKLDPNTARVVALDAKTAAAVVAARDQAEAAYKKTPGDVSPLVVLTWIYMDKKMYGDALLLAERVVAARPDSRDAREVLYELYMKLGFSKQADEMKKRTGTPEPR